MNEKQKLYRDLSSIFFALFLTSLILICGNKFYCNEIPYLSIWLTALFLILCVIFYIIFINYHVIKNIDPEKPFFDEKLIRNVKHFFFAVGIGFMGSGLFGFYLLHRIKAEPVDTLFCWKFLFIGTSILTILGFIHYFKVNRELNSEGKIFDL